MSESFPFFRRGKPIIGMIHVGALPGTPRARQSLSALAGQVAREADVYRQTGVDGILVENMHDRPYCRGAVGPEIVAAMTTLALAAKAKSGLPVGVQILAGANREALAVALAAGLEFIRVEGFVYAHIADEGLHQSCAAELLRFRRAIGADHIRILADIKKKHSSHAITADISLAETAAAAEFMGADAVIVTGAVTGSPPNPEDLRECRIRAAGPLFVGSGISATNLIDFFGVADGYIIGSDFKVAGDWQNPVDAKRVENFISHLDALRPTTILVQSPRAGTRT